MSYNDELSSQTPAVEQATSDGIATQAPILKQDLEVQQPVETDGINLTNSEAEEESDFDESELADKGKGITRDWNFFNRYRKWF